MSPAKARIGGATHVTPMVAGEPALIADEPLRLGGGDKGLAPDDLLLSSLGGLHRDRAEDVRRGRWLVADVDLALERSKNAMRIVRVGLNDDPRQRMAETAEKAPVTLTLRSGIAIDTRLA